MRFIALAICASLLCGAAHAQSFTPVRTPDAANTTPESGSGNGAGDSNWMPTAKNLSQAPDVPVRALGGVGTLGTQYVPMGTKAPYVEPVVQPPPTPTAKWTWAASQVCVTTCNGSVCDANQWQTCEGSACPYPGRGCYAVWSPAVAAQNGGFSVNPGTPAPDGCYSMVLQNNAMLCRR